MARNDNGAVRRGIRAGRPWSPHLEETGDAIDMKKRNALGVATLMICAVLGGSAQTAPQQTAPPPLPDVQKLGPQVGTRVPDFTLVDQKLSLIHI